ASALGHVGRDASAPYVGWARSPPRAAAAGWARLDFQRARWDAGAMVHAKTPAVLLAVLALLACGDDPPAVPRDCEVVIIRDFPSDAGVPSRETRKDQ